MNAKEYVIGALDKLIDDIYENDTNYYVDKNGNALDMNELIENVRMFQWKIDLYFDEKGENK